MLSKREGVRSRDEEDDMNKGKRTTRGEKGESRDQIESGHKPYLESSHDGVWTS